MARATGSTRTAGAATPTMAKSTRSAKSAKTAAGSAARITVYWATISKNESRKLTSRAATAVEIAGSKATAISKLSTAA